MFWAAYKGNVTLIKYLIELGSEIEFTNAKGTNILLMSGFGASKTLALRLFSIQGSKHKFK